MLSPTKLARATQILNQTINQDGPLFEDTLYRRRLFPLVQLAFEKYHGMPHESGSYTEEAALDWFISLLHQQQESTVQIAAEVKPILTFLLAKMRLMYAGHERAKKLAKVGSVSTTTEEVVDDGATVNGLIRQQLDLSLNKLPDAVLNELVAQELTEPHQLGNSNIKKANEFVAAISKKANTKSALWHEANERRIGTLQAILKESAPDADVEAQAVEFTGAQKQLATKVVANNTLASDKLARAIGLTGSWGYGFAIAGEVGASIVEYFTDDYVENPNYFLDFKSFGAWDYVAQATALVMIGLVLKTIGPGYVGRLEGIAQGLLSSLLSTKPRESAHAGILCMRAICFALAGFASFANSTPVKNAYVRQENRDLILGLLTYLPSVIQSVVAWTLASIHFAVLGKLYSSAMLNTNFLQLKSRYLTPFSSNETLRVAAGEDLGLLKRLDKKNAAILLSTVAVTLPSIAFRVLFNASHMFRTVTGADHVPVDDTGQRLPIPAYAYSLAGLATLVTFTYLVDNSARLAKGLAARSVTNPDQPLYKFLSLTIGIMASALGLLTLTAFKDHPKLNNLFCGALNFIGSIIYMFSSTSANTMYNQSKDSMIEVARHGGQNREQAFTDGNALTRVGTFGRLGGGGHGVSQTMPPQSTETPQSNGYLRRIDNGI